MPKTRLRAGLALVLVVPSMAAASIGPVGPRAQEVDALARGLPGFSGAVLLAKSHQIVLERGYGQTRADALFDIGSVAKIFTAAAILRLEQAGKLKVDDRISRYLPGVPRGRSEVTIRQLLTHTGGLPEYFDSDRERVGRADAIRRILRARGPRPGRFSYSNAGYTLLAAIVERVGGEPFQRYVREHLLRPAGMDATGWFDTTFAGRPRARGFANGRDRGPAGTQVPLSWSIIGAGGMLSTVGDLYRWDLALAGGRVLSAAERAKYERAYVRVPGLRNARAGYGWIVGRSPRGTRVILVGGGTDFGFTADFRRFASENAVLLTLSATDRQPAERVAPLLERRFFAAL
jgi:CubicO group peptidase (beta-lactamase class C family)